jgi:hypothetical protein
MQGNEGDGWRRIFRKRQTGNRQKYGRTVARFRLRGHLMAQMAVRTLRLVHRIMVVPAADDHRCEHQQCHQRQRNARDTQCVSDSHSDGFESVTNRIDSNWMSDVGKALPVSEFVEVTPCLPIGFEFARSMVRTACIRKIRRFVSARAPGW